MNKKLALHKESVSSLKNIIQKDRSETGCNAALSVFGLGVSCLFSALADSCTC